MAVRLLHLSDLHAGGHDEGWDAAGDAVRTLAERLRPDLVVASGDLTHRNRRSQHERAAAFLRSLGAPVLAVPGNHDMPALPPARLLATFDAFRDVWGESEPVHRAGGLLAVGLCSARPWLYQEGVLTRSQLARVAEELASAPPGALRVVVLHHHLCSAPWRTAKRPVFRRASVLAALADAGAELVLSGHVHQSSVLARAEFEVAGDRVRPLVVATAPGLGRPRPRRRGEAAGLHAVEADERELRVSTYALREGGLDLVAERTFPRAAATA